MDDISGDIIYIVLTLVVVLISALRKKKAPQKPESAPHREVGDPMDEVFPTLRDLFTEPEEEAPVAPSAESLDSIESQGQPETVSGSPGNPFVRSDYKFPSSSSAGEASRQRKMRKKKSELTRVRTQIDEEDVKEQESFDLKRAIVYSEILKRPDF